MSIERIDVAGAALYLGDALEVLRSLPDSSVDLIATDPPYFRVKGLAWDRAWDNAAGFIAWIGQLTDEWARVLKPNGSLYCFASPKMAARVEVEIGKRLEVLNRITWRKPPYSTKAEMFRKEDLRMFFPASEAVIFAEHFGADNAAKGESGYGAECDKPLDLCEHIILASSRPGAVVLDSFCGSGAFGEAAVKHGRTFIGSDSDPHWIERAAQRIASAQPAGQPSNVIRLPRTTAKPKKPVDDAQPTLFDLMREQADTDPPQQSLFDAIAAE